MSRRRHKYGNASLLRLHKGLEPFPTFQEEVDAWCRAVMEYYGLYDFLKSQSNEGRDLLPLGKFILNRNKDERQKTGLQDIDDEIGGLDSNKENKDER